MYDPRQQAYTHETLAPPKDLSNPAEDLTVAVLQQQNLPGEETNCPQFLVEGKTTIGLYNPVDIAIELIAYGQSVDVDKAVRLKAHLDMQLAIRGHQLEKRHR